MVYINLSIDNRAGSNVNSTGDITDSEVINYALKLHEALLQCALTSSPEMPSEPTP